MQIKFLPKKLFIFVVLIAIYFASGKLGLRLAFLHVSATPVWPPTGIALTALLLFGYKYWPAVFIGAFLTNITNEGNIATTLGIATGNTLEAILGAYLINHFANGRRVFEKAGDVARFVILAGLVSTAASATIGVTVLTLGGFAPLMSYPSIWLTWWLGDLGGNLIFAPFLILRIERWHIGSRTKNTLDALLITMIIILVSLTVFMGVPFGLDKPYPIEFILVPFVVLTAFRFKQRGAATITVLISLIAILATINGLGPFSGRPINESLLLVQTFMSVISITGLTVGAVVSEKQRALKTLKEDEKKLRKLDEAKNEFIGLAAHELRTPLGHIRWNAEALLDKRVANLSTPIRKRVKALYKDCLEMTQMIDELLDVTKIIQGAVPTTLEPVNIGSVISNEVSILQPMANQKLVILNVRTPRQNIPEIFVDKKQLAQVIQNLISNAIKFNTRGGHVDVSYKKDKENIHITVSDTGIGIPGKDQLKIFTKFFRARNAMLKQISGTGLGLFIVKSYIDSWNGRVWFESPMLKNGRGTAFHIKFPIRKVQTAKL